MYTSLLIPMAESESQAVARVSNDIGNFIRIGTLHFYDLPKNCGFQSVPVGCSGWKWFDADFLSYAFTTSLSPVLKSLVYLVLYRYAAATYQTCQVTLLPGTEPLTVCKVRVYVIPFDVLGSRYLKDWRLKRLLANLAKKFHTEWFNLVNVLDYSASGWSATAAKCSLSSFLVSSKILLPFLGSWKPKSSSFHIDRWIGRREYLPDSLKKEDESIETIVQRVYSQIKVPDLSLYETPTKKSEVPTSEEQIAELLSGYETNHRLVNGVTSTLYPFQLKSICKMFEKEAHPRRKPVPNFVKLTCPKNTDYYFDLLDSGFYKMPELYTLPRGGILAENMGLGKTLICLSLICITKYEVSTIPEDIILHHDQSIGLLEDRPVSFRVKTLAEISRDTINQNSLPWKYYEDDLPSSVIEKLTHHPGYFRISLDYNQNQWGLRAKEKNVSTFQTLYLCNTTLIVVPENLFHQWNNELKKHVDPSYLRKLFVSDRFKVPLHTNGADYTDKLSSDPREVIKYDLVVITVPLFAKLRGDDDIVRKIYWKRLIIDEGHSMSSKSSNLSMLCSSIHAERRWAVTGTPVSGMTSLHMNEEEHEDVEQSPTKKKRKYIVKSRFNVRDDLTRVGNLVGNYFKIEPFHSQPKLWNSTIVKNLVSSMFSSSVSLQSLLDSLMIRHDLASIEQDLNLPQLHHEVVFLQPSYQNKLAINLFTAVLAVNAVSSEREGSDYMFDPTNRQQLRRLVNNLQLATFYWTGFKQEDVETLIGIANHCIKKKTSTGEAAFNADDIQLVERSLEAANQALHNPRWRTASLLHEMQYYVTGLPDLFVKAFGTGILNPDVSVFGAPQLAAVQDFFYKNRFMDMKHDEILREKIQAVSKPFWENYWNDASKKKVTKFNKQESAHDFDVHAIRNLEADEKVIPVSRKASTSQNWDKTKDLLTTDSGEGLRETESATTGTPEEMKRASVLGTASSKLLYLSCRLVEHQRAGVKSIVFFEYEDSAYYLTELLDILGVNYILYATFISAGQRSNNLTDFDNYNLKQDGGITLIMDLRLAAHGLTIISATRVYFMSPVWQLSVEAQAIKRAHRIGQTNEVHVETLVLKGTLEEEIYKRRAAVQPENQDNLRRYVIDDTGMQQFILKHEFLPMDSENEYSSFSVPEGEDSTLLETEGSFEESALVSHTMKRRYSLQWLHDWSMHIFTQENLEKLNASKRQKPDSQRLNVELVQSKPENQVEKRSVAVKRKAVRF